MIGTFLLTISILLLKQFHTFEVLLEDGQKAIVDWFEANNAIYIILVILLISLAKGVGIKDPLSLRTMSVVVLACKTTSDPALRFLLASLIMGLLSSLAKLLEYKTISHELQLVIGTPVCLVFRYARKLLALILRCSGVSDPSASLQWLDPQWILKISRIARDDPAMHVMRNFSRVLEKQPSDAPPEDHETIVRNAKCKRALWTALEFALAVLWTSVIEWVPPISELFLYAHNWSLSLRSVTLIVLSELADIDRMAELAFLLSRYPDLFGGKVDSLLAKPMFWAIGYVVVMPLTLLWAYRFWHRCLLVEDADRCAGCETVGCALEFGADHSHVHVVDLRLDGLGRGMSGVSGQEDDELPPMERTTTPFLMDASRTQGSKTSSKDGWDRFNFDHHAEAEHPLDIEVTTAFTGLELRTSTMESTAV